MHLGVSDCRRRQHQRRVNGHGYSDNRRRGVEVNMIYDFVIVFDLSLPAISHQYE